jgi:DNA-binding CsgD family transcriptional regulator
VTPDNSIPLTPRQLELLALVASGLTIEEAAEKAFMAPRSAYNTLSLARTRSGCKTVTQLAVRAIIKGWLQSDDEGQLSPAPATVSV